VFSAICAVDAGMLYRIQLYFTDPTDGMVVMIIAYPAVPDGGEVHASGGESDAPSQV
jgi:hypothetical protein